MTTMKKIKRYGQWWLAEAKAGWEEAKTGWDDAEAQVMADINPLTITLAILLLIAEGYLFWHFIVPDWRIPPAVVSFFHRV